MAGPAPSESYRAPLLSADREAVEEAVPSGAAKVLLTAPLGGMSRVPGGWVRPSSSPVEMANRRATFSAARPVVARRIVVP